MTRPHSPFGTDKVPEINPYRENDTGKWLSKEEKNLTPQQWGMFALNHFKAISHTTKTLEPGAYDITHDEQDGKSIFIKKSLIHDAIIPLSGLPAEIVSEINDFWGKGEDFAKLGFLHRRGYLLYGSHGTGKSSLVHEIADRIIADGGIVFYCDNPEFFNQGLSTFRRVEPNRKVVCIFEDVDAIIKKYGESQLLSLLDGENQISHVCNLATTNYPELLDKRIVGRPRRFDRVYRIGNLDKKARQLFLEKKLPNGADTKEWLKKTGDLSIASISEIIISVFCFDKPLDEAIEIVKTLTEDKSSTDDRESLGFDREHEE